MRIALRKVSYNPSLSQETSAFTADIGRYRTVGFGESNNEKPTLID